MTATSTTTETTPVRADGTPCVTQLDFARAGVITPAMRAVAEREGRDPEFIRAGVAAGRIAIPANIRHLAGSLKPAGVGDGLSTKVNVNLGISGDVANADVEWEKVATAEKFGADAIMDLSNSGKTRFFRTAWTSSPSTAASTGASSRPSRRPAAS